MYLTLRGPHLPIKFHSIPNSALNYCRIGQLGDVSNHRCDIFFISVHVKSLVHKQLNKQYGSCATRKFEYSYMLISLEERYAFVSTLGSTWKSIMWMFDMFVSILAKYSLCWTHILSHCYTHHKNKDMPLSIIFYATSRKATHPHDYV